MEDDSLKDKMHLTVKRDSYLRKDKHRTTQNFSLKTFSHESKQKKKIGESDIFHGPSFRCYEDKVFEKKDIDTKSKELDEHEIELSSEDQGQSSEKSIQSKIFGSQDQKTTNKDASSSDINLSSFQQSKNETPPAWKLESKDQLQKPTQTKLEESLEDPENSTLQEESEDITLTMVSNSQQLSSQMNLRPSIQFMNQDQTDEFQFSERTESPFVQDIKGVMGNSMKNSSVLGNVASNHKFSYSEDLTKVFEQIKKQDKPGKIKKMDTIKDIEDPVEKPQTTTFMNQEFFRTLGEDEQTEMSRKESQRYMIDVESEEEEEQSGVEFLKVDKWPSSEEFVDKSKFLNSQNLRSSRQML